MVSFVSEFVGQAVATKTVQADAGNKQVTKALFSRKPAAPAKGTKAGTKKAVTKKAAPKKVAAPKKAPTPSSGDYNLDKWYGADRAIYLPNGLLARENVPSYLTGELAGDYGFDPLSLSAKGDLEKYRAFELLHARWAMLAIPGMLLPEYQSFTSNNTVVQPEWFQTGAGLLDDGILYWFGIPIPFNLIGVLAVEFVLMGAIENYRNEGGPLGEGLDPLYPGGTYFDPLGLADDPDAFAELKVKEIKNGRLAMVAVFGFAWQAYVTGEGPYANWSQHVADPFGYNLFTVVGGASERVPTL